MTKLMWNTIYAKKDYETFTKLKEYEKTDVKYGIYCGLIRKKEIGNLTELTEYMSNPPPLPTSIHQKLFHMNTTCLFHIKRRQKQTKSGKWNKEKEVVRIEDGVDEYNIGAARIVHSSQYQLLGPPLELLFSFGKK